MEVSTYFGDNLAVTGSEESFSHKGTCNIDLGIIGKGSRKRYAPFTCKVVAIDTNYNTLTCESVGKVICPRFPKGEILCFSVGHLNKLDFKVGEVIKQKTLLGEDSLKGTDLVHTHWSFGIGKLKMPNFLTKMGTYNGNRGIYALACQGWIHSYDFWFLDSKVAITTEKSNPAFKYPYQYLTNLENKEITVKGRLIKKEGNVYTLEGKEL